MIDLRTLAMWPPRSLGLDRGRSLINAWPAAAEHRAGRLELWAYAQERFGAECAAAPALGRGDTDGS